MDREEQIKQEEYSKMVTHNSILLKFGGWIQYVEGLARGIEAAKTVDANSVLECIAEIMEYMKTLKKDIMDILTYCESVLEKEERLDVLEQQLTKQMETIQNGLLIECKQCEEGKEEE